MSLAYTTRVADGVDFAYRDSGAPPNKQDYCTCIIIHGHTFHSAVFLPMIEAAHSVGYRVIAPNRRLYPGSTTYTKQEVEALESGTPDEIERAWTQQGGYLLSFVDNMIQEHDLNEVILIGWSMGSGFLSATVCSMPTFAADAKARLRRHVKGLIWWDPPSQIHGIRDPPSGGWLPLLDQNLPPELRGKVFAEWVMQYFPHANLKEKDCSNLIYKNTTQTKPATYSNFSFEEVLGKIDITAGQRGDNTVSGSSDFVPGRILFERTFLDKETRKEWGDIQFSVLYGEESPWNVVWAVWEIERLTEKAELPVYFKSIAGANHFTMQDNVAGTYDAFIQCIQASMDKGRV
uniref:AB hydrolase-1 domain-containing protein n=1 Tax=Psilocybe cubensis TaxID=181762 RepID=A0A8H7XQY1_PSICU